MISLIIALAFVVCTTVTPVLSGDVTVLDLARLAAGQDWKIHNRSVQVVVKDGKNAVQFGARASDGLAWLPGFSFENGEIECDILGRSQPIQGSFVGIAFRVQDEKTFDAVYFRPFNFRVPERSAHSVQYISHPDWTWNRLRSERTGQYEKAIDPAPDGDQWIHARIVVRKPKVEVYVNGAAIPSLVVDELSPRTGGSVGLFVGNGSPGTFANLKVSREK
jgi:hypothetical protein